MSEKENDKIDLSDPILQKRPELEVMRRELKPLEISRSEGINKTIEELVKYCKRNNVKSFKRVELACKVALSSYIKVFNRSKYEFAINHPMFDNKFDFLVNQTANRLNIYPEIAPPRLIAKMVEQKETSVNPIEFLVCTYLLMPNLDPIYFTKNMNNIRTSVNVLWDRLSGVKHSSLQSMLYLYSTEGGVGKSVFQNIMKEWAKSRGIRVVNTRVPSNQFIGDEFNKNAICIFSDITRSECENWNKINDLIDGTDYVVEQKGIDRYELKAQAFLIGSSNFHPKDENNRRIDQSFIHYGTTRLEPISKFDAFKTTEKGYVDIDYYLPIVDHWILSCPQNDFDFSNFPTKITSSVAEWFNGIDDDYVYVIKAIARFYLKGKLGTFDFRDYTVSVATLTNRINKLVGEDGIDDIDRSYRFSRKQINHVLKVLEKNRLIKIESEASGVYQRKYNLHSLADNALKIAFEEINNNYTDMKQEELDYVKEERVVMDVVEQIREGGEYDYTDFCRKYFDVVPF